VRPVKRSSSHVGSDNISEHHNHPDSHQPLNISTIFAYLPGRLGHLQIEYLDRHHSNLGRHLHMVLRHTAALNTGLLLGIHMLLVAPSEHIFRHPRRNGQLDTEDWSCAVLSGEGRTEIRRCLTELEMVVVV